MHLLRLSKSRWSSLANLGSCIHEQKVGWLTCMTLKPVLCYCMQTSFTCKFVKCKVQTVLATTQWFFHPFKQSNIPLKVNHIAYKILTRFWLLNCKNMYFFKSATAHMWTGMTEIMVCPFNGSCKGTPVLDFLRPFIVWAFDTLCM